MAIVTLIYNITHSGTLVASIYIFRTLAIFASGLIVPATIKLIKNKKQLLIALDFIRAGILLLLIFFPWVSSVYIAVFACYLLNGFYYPVKQLAIQTLIGSEDRMHFISRTQTYSYFIHFIAPLITGVLLSYISAQFLIVIDVLTFLVSGALLIKLTAFFDEDTGSQEKSFFINLITGYKNIFFTQKQRNLLSFRLLLLFALSIYDVLVMIVLTNFSKNMAFYELPAFFSFPLLFGLFSSLTAVATMIASFFTQNIVRLEKLDSTAKTGIFCLILGLLFWICPYSFKYCWLFFILGTFLIGFGLSFSRFFLYTAGYELTEKQLFIQIVSSSDAIARLWQSGVSTFTIAIASFFPLSGVIILSCFTMSFALLPIKSLVRAINDRQSSSLTNALQDP